MSLTVDEKTAIIGKVALGKTDTGSPEVQIALLTARIQKLTSHFVTHKNDHHSKRGFIKLVKARQRLLFYLKKEDEQRYNELVKVLGLRK